MADDTSYILLQFSEEGEFWNRNQAVYYCRCCSKYLPSTQFFLSTTMRHLGKCKSCTTKENIATQRQDDSVFTRLLRYIRFEENKKLSEEARRKRSVTSEEEEASVAKRKAVAIDESITVMDNPALRLMQEADLRYLIETIWNHQSSISGVKSLVTSR